MNSTELKSCCAAFYESDWVHLLLGDTLRPGGLALTERIGRLLELRAEDRVLEVAAGTGASAMFLAQRFGCEVVGVDYSAQAVARATARAVEAGLAGRVRFEQGDAERLPADGASFDVVLCECAFSTFPDKLSAAAEFARVLRLGGRLGLADVTRNGPLPPELDALLARVACLGDARPVEEYRTYLCAAGFGEPLVETHDRVLVELAGSIEQKLQSIEVLVRAGALTLPVEGVEQATRLLEVAAEAADHGRLGYALLVARRWSPGGGR